MQILNKKLHKNRYFDIATIHFIEIMPYSQKNPNTGRPSGKYYLSVYPICPSYKFF